MRDPYPERTLLGFSRVDGTVWFYSRIAALLSSDSKVLDIGCGRGAAAADPLDYRRSLTILKGRCAHVMGIDVSPEGQANPLVDEFRLIERPERWPIDDMSVDLAICDWVVEHVEAPRKFFAECSRVLQPGGTLCIRTPNLLGYPALIARAVPKSWHARLLRSVQPSRSEIDVFPAFYRCNTRRSLTQALTSAGFHSVVMPYEAEPAYLDFSPTLYRVAASVNQHLPPALRRTLVAFARRREAL